MKVMIASDIHGSALFCEKLIEAYNAEQPDKLVLLGDLLYHGPRNDIPGGYDTKKVAALLNGIKENIICVRGNCDSEVDQMVLDFPIKADYALLYIGGKTAIFSMTIIHRKWRATSSFSADTHTSPPAMITARFYM